VVPIRTAAKLVKSDDVLGFQWWCAKRWHVAQACVAGDGQRQQADDERQHSEEGEIAAVGHEQPDLATRDRRPVGATRLNVLVRPSAHGLRHGTRCPRPAHRAIERLALDTSHFAGRSWSRGATVPSRVRPLEDYLSNKYPIQSDRLRRRLVNEGVFERRCTCCKLDTWMDQPIPLELDHIDGNHQTNALDNLRLLCLNCHSLTPTFRGKNKRPAPTLNSAA
jgi:hypothetical protein